MSNQFQIMKERIEELEQRVEHLRVSRRVLMNLVEKIEKEKNYITTRLEKENRRLQRHNAMYAQSLLLKNRRIMELEEEIESRLSRLS